jgi:hypothetical protein
MTDLSLSRLSVYLSSNSIAEGRSPSPFLRLVLAVLLVALSPGARLSLRPSASRIARSSSRPETTSSCAHQQTGTAAKQNAAASNDVSFK